MQCFFPRRAVVFYVVFSINCFDYWDIFPPLSPGKDVCNADRLLRCREQQTRSRDGGK
jgi:hypothetical protein